MKSTVLSVFTAALVAGCAHRKPSPTLVVPAPVERPLAGDSLDAIRYPAIYKAYSVGRQIDPQNPRIMHEGGRVYVREYPDAWNLHPQPNAVVPMGPSVSPTNAAYSPLPLTEELKQELNVQKQATKAVQQRAVELGQAVGQLAPVAKSMSEQQQQILRQLQSTDQRLRLLETTLAHPSSSPTNAPSSTNRAPGEW